MKKNMSVVSKRDFDFFQRGYAMGFTEAQVEVSSVGNKQVRRRRKGKIGRPKGSKNVNSSSANA